MRWIVFAVIGLLVLSLFSGGGGGSWGRSSNGISPIRVVTERVKPSPEYLRTQRETLVAQKQALEALKDERKAAAGLEREVSGARHELSLLYVVMAVMGCSLAVLCFVLVRGRRGIAHAHTEI